tara:strand:+ start:2032 stop:2220 length:189 start_codon:yes stop_codon:yes gene_type:complete
MILKTIILKPEEIISLCAVCVTDRNGGQIALIVIVSSLVILGLINWGLKKYYLNKKQRSEQK